MSTDIRRADLAAERALIIDSLRRWLAPDSDDRRFDWLYRDNPAGPARVFLASDAASGATIGVGAAFPRRMVRGEAELVAWVLGDFCIDPAHRSLGPALALQRACLSVAEEDGPSFCYDFPSQGMMAVYKRLRIEPLGNLVRFARPLRVDRKVREVVDMPGVTRALSAAGNLVLGLREAMAAADRSVDVALHEGPCGDEFSALARDVQGVLGLCTQRSAEYLSWRYLGPPHLRHELLTARRDGALLAWAAFTHGGDEAMLVDLFGVDEPSVVGTLVNALARLLRKRGAATLSAPLWESHRLVPLMRELGFSPREPSPVVVHAPAKAPAAPCPGETDWFLWHGDRDS
jgi:hypothetical protein